MPHPQPLHTVLVTGYAKAPQGTGMFEQFKSAGVVLEIDPETDEIVRADATFVTPLAREFFNRMLAGRRLTADLEELVQVVQTHYLAASQQAVLTALRVAGQRYFDLRRKQSGEN